MHDMKMLSPVKFINKKKEDYILHVKMNQAGLFSRRRRFKNHLPILEKKFCLNTGGEEVLSSNSILLSWSSSYECDLFYFKGSLFFES